jgi:hypothetical protein
MSVYILRDTFNHVELSRHRTIRAAIEARDKHLRAVKRANGRDAYLTYAITQADGEPVDKNELEAELRAAYQRRFS